MWHLGNLDQLSYLVFKTNMTGIILSILSLLSFSLKHNTLHLCVSSFTFQPLVHFSFCCCCWPRWNALWDTWLSEVHKAFGAYLAVCILGIRTVIGWRLATTWCSSWIRGVWFDCGVKTWHVICFHMGAITVHVQAFTSSSFNRLSNVFDNLSSFFFCHHATHRLSNRHWISPSCLCRSIVRREEMLNNLLLLVPSFILTIGHTKLILIRQ